MEEGCVLLLWTREEGDASIEQVEVAKEERTVYLSQTSEVVEALKE